MRVNQLVGERLLLARRRAGLSQAEVGREFEVSSNTVYRWERGTRGPDLETLYDLAALYRVPVTFFFQDLDLELQRSPEQKRGSNVSKRRRAGRDHAAPAPGGDLPDP